MSPDSRAPSGGSRRRAATTSSIAPDYDGLREFVRRPASRRGGHASGGRRGCGELVRAALDAAGSSHRVFDMGEGEDAKTLATIEALARDFAQWGLLRGDLVLAVGGGVVGDTAGFAAAVHLRGVDVVQVPTTLLAMVDSAIGGKTGVNLPEGKNLVGAFHQPRAVFVNPTVLAHAARPRVPLRPGRDREVRLDGRRFRVGARRHAAYKRDPAVLAGVIARCIEIKAAVVAADELERTGARAVLNYGHTLAHALETASGHALMHGEAVAIGLVFAIAARCGARRSAAEVAARHRAARRGARPAARARRAASRRPARDHAHATRSRVAGSRSCSTGRTGSSGSTTPTPARCARPGAAVGVEA